MDFRSYTETWLFVYFIGSCPIISYGWSVFTANIHAENIKETISIKQQNEISQR